MRKLTVAIVALALSTGVAFAQGGFGGQAAGGAQGGFGGGAAMGGAQGGFGGGMGGFGGGIQGGQGGQGGQRGNRPQGGQGAGGMQGGFGGMQGGMGGMGGFGGGAMGGMQGGMGGFGGFGGGAMGGMGGQQNGQLARYIERLKAPSARQEAETKIEAKFKDDYAKIIKEIEAADAKLADLAKKAEVELPATQEESAKALVKFFTDKKADIDKLIETDKTDSRAAMQSFRELATAAKIDLTAVAQQGGRQSAFGQQRQPGQGGQRPGQGAAGQRPGQPGAAGQPGAQGRGNNTNILNQIKEKFPTEYAEAEKLRTDDPTAYREKIRELRNKLQAAPAN